MDNTMVITPVSNPEPAPTNKKTLERRANKCTTCWGKKKITIYRSAFPIVLKGITGEGKHIYTVNPEVIACSCQN